MKTVVITVIVTLLVLMNAAAWLLMAVDKRRARKGQWRIPERTLFLVTGLFGGLGGTLGMFMMHHKTKHWYFRIGFPLLLIIQAAVLIWAGVTWL